jgi:hypothetical protein
LQNEIGIFFFATNRTAFSGKTDMKIAFRFWQMRISVLRCFAWPI